MAQAIVRFLASDARLQGGLMWAAGLGAALIVALKIAFKVGRNRDEKRLIFERWSGSVIWFFLGVLAACIVQQVVKSAIQEHEAKGQESVQHER